MKYQLLQPVLIVLFLCLVSPGFSQDPDLVAAPVGDSITSQVDSVSGTVPPLTTVKNAVKTDLLSWIFGAGVLKYERVFADNFSAQLGFYYAWDFPAYDEGYAATGFSITPEFRHYMSKKRPAPGGPYLAPVFRYQKLKTENHWESSEATVITYSMAIHFGFQLILKEIFVADTWIGPAINIRNVIEETAPGTEIGYRTDNSFGVRFGIAIGLGF